MFSGSGLADLEPDEAVDLEAGLVQDLLHRALGLGDRRLLEQDEVLVVGVDPTLDDLADRLLGLALLLGRLLGDPALGLDRLGRDLLAGQVARASRGDGSTKRRAASRKTAAPRKTAAKAKRASASGEAKPKTPRKKKTAKTADAAE